MARPHNDAYQTSDSRAILAVILCAALIGGAAAAAQALSGAAPGTYPLSIDFYSFWSGFQLFARGENFYDHSLLLQEELRHSLHTSGPIYYPPWMLVIVSPVCALPFALAVTLFAALNAALAVWLGAAAWRIVSKRPPFLWTAAGSLLFVPVINAIQFGQLSLVVTAGMYGALLFHREKKHLAAGLCLALVSIKPHLFYLLLAAFFWDMLKNREFRTIVFCTAAVALLAAAGEAAVPGALANFFSQAAGTSVHAPVSGVTPLRHLSESLGILRGAWVPFIFPAAALTAVILLKLNGRLSIGDPKTAVHLIFWSLFTSPYLWIFDHSAALVLQTAVIAALPARLLGWSLVVIYQTFVFYLETLDILDSRLWWYAVPLYVFAVFAGRNFQAARRTKG